MKNIIFVFAIVISAINFSFAQNDGPRAERVKAMKAAYITTELELSTEESEKFWPVYNEFQEKLKSLRVNKWKGKSSLSDLSDAEAMELMEKQFDLEEERIRVSRDYAKRLSTIISPKRLIKLREAEREFKKELLKRVRDERGGQRRRDRQ